MLQPGNCQLPRLLFSITPELADLFPKVLLPSATSREHNIKVDRFAGFAAPFKLHRLAWSLGFIDGSSVSSEIPRNPLPDRLPRASVLSISPKGNNEPRYAPSFSVSLDG